jgi:signal transduction histidine kinase
MTAGGGGLYAAVTIPQPPPAAWFPSTNTAQLTRERHLCLEERCKERARIARELHDTLFQGFLGASMLLHNAVEQIPADSPSKPSFNHALSLIRRVIDEGRLALQGLRSTVSAYTTLEQAFTDLLEQFAPDGVRSRILVSGKPRALALPVQEQIYWIGREALVNALLHSDATSIEAEVEYLPRGLRLVVRDNGCGMDQQAVQAKRDLHWGLAGMRERAKGVGARLQVWSRRGSGTEVEVSVPLEMAAEACA